MSLKNLHNNFFFLFFFLSLSLVTFFFLSFFLLLFLFEWYLGLHWLRHLCTRHPRNTRNLVISYLRLYFVTDYIWIYSTLQCFLSFCWLFTNVVDLHFTKFLLNFELLNWMSWLSIQCIIVSLFTAYILVFNIIQVYWILLQISYRSVILKTVFRLSFLILTSRNYCLPTDCWFFI